MCLDHKKIRPGATLSNRQAHEQEHKNWSRRDFLTASGLVGAGSLLLGALPVHAFQPTPLMAALAAGGNDRILVLIRLNGGNDGLNTVIERGNPDYYNLRPTLAVPDTNLWAMSNEYGMPQSSAALQPMWEDGMMKVIFNVGYPEPNYSHFRSSDIWATGSGAEETWQTGWIGRFLDHDYPAFLETPPTIPPALQIGVQTNLLFRADGANMALAVSSPEEFYQIAQTGQLYDTASLGPLPHEVELGFVRQTANAAFRYANTIKDAYARGKNQVAYPQDNYLAEQMAIVARLIKGQLGTRIFLVEIGGFDTHAEQSALHLELLQKLGTAVKAFYDDLAAANSGLEQKVLGMTFSEFGRTIYENASLGTDHGWGTHLLLFGGGLGNGFVGQYQDLSNPDPYTDPPFSVDFRSIYATVLQDWLGNPPDLVDFVLGAEHTRLNGLVPSTVPFTGENGRCALLGHNPHPTSPATMEIKYAMMQDGPLRLQLLDKAGHVLRTLVNEYKDRGSYTFALHPPAWFVPPGEYRYRLQAGGQIFQRAIQF